jgi:site-specific recombinase XerD
MSRPSNVLRFQRHAASTWEEALDRLIDFKTAQGRSEQTITDYRQHIGFFYRTYPQAWEEANLNPCLLKFFARKMGPATYNLYLIYLKAFVDWCIEEEGAYARNPLAKFKQKKEEARIVDIPMETVKKLLNLPDQGTYTGLRDYSLFLLSLDTGIRPKEALTLLPKDVNLKGLEVTVRAENAKTRVSRTLPISRITAEAIGRLLDGRPQKWGDLCPVFANWEGTPMRPNSWGMKMNKKYSRQLKTKIRPYDLRHVFALNFLRNEGNIFALQRIMGHANLDMTKRYLALTKDDLKDNHGKASPVNSLLPKRTRMTRL